MSSSNAGAVGKGAGVLDWVVLGVGNAWANATFANGTNTQAASRGKPIFKARRGGNGVFKVDG